MSLREKKHNSTSKTSFNINRSIAFNIQFVLYLIIFLITCFCCLIFINQIKHISHTSINLQLQILIMDSGIVNRFIFSRSTFNSIITMEHIKHLARCFDQVDSLSDQKKFNLYLEMYFEIWLKSFASIALKNFLKTVKNKQFYFDLLLSAGIELEKSTLFNDLQSTHRLAGISKQTITQLIAEGRGLKPVPYKFFKHPLIYKVLTSHIDGIDGSRLTSIFIEFCLENKWNPYTYLIDILSDDPESCLTGQFTRITAALLPMTNKPRKTIYEYEKAKFFHFLNNKADSIHLIESVQIILNTEKIHPKKYINLLLKEYTGIEWTYNKFKWNPIT